MSLKEMKRTHGVGRGRLLCNWETQVKYKDKGPCWLREVVLLGLASHYPNPETPRDPQRLTTLIPDSLSICIGMDIRS